MTRRHAAVMFSLLATGAVALAAGWGGGGAAMSAGGGAAAESARRLGFELRETKEELKLIYDLQVQDNGGGRVSVTFTLADEGRIKPLSAVKVATPSADKSGYFDLVATLAPFEKDGKKVYVIQLTRELTERGELDLVTSTMDGKRMLDWGYHRVALGPALKAADEKAAEKAKEPKVGEPAVAPAANTPPAAPAR